MFILFGPRPEVCFEFWPPVQLSLIPLLYIMEVEKIKRRGVLYLATVKILGWLDLNVVNNVNDTLQTKELRDQFSLIVTESWTQIVRFILVTGASIELPN